MSRLIAAVQGVTLLCGLVFAALPPDLACCAGVAPVHGADCCDAAATDRRAGSCCEGDGAALAVRPESPSSRPLAVAAPAALGDQAHIRLAGLVATPSWQPAPHSARCARSSPLLL